MFTTLSSLIKKDWNDLFLVQSRASGFRRDVTSIRVYQLMQLNYLMLNKEEALLYSITNNTTSGASLRYMCFIDAFRIQYQQTKMT